jgi:Superfamily II helicase and inactivated derivatives
VNQGTGPNNKQNNNPQEDTQRFLNALYGNLESGNLYLWTLPDHKTWPFSIDELSMMGAAAQAIQDDRDVYFGLGGSMSEIKDNERLLANNVSFIPCLWMDIDILGPAHKQTDLPPTMEDALSVLPDFLRPSITVFSGNGLHMYWLLKEIWLFETQDDNLRASNLMINLQAYIKKLASERGWKFDSTADLSRVLRVPGTLNHKLGNNSPVYITGFNPDLRYDPSGLEDIIPETDFRTEITNHGSFERRPTDASSDLMIASCQFLQHCLINAQTITYGEWLSMLTNVIRGTDGVEKCHELSSPDKGRYTPKSTDFKLTEALKMNPHTCDYIRANHGFQCPSGGCGVKSPCSFSLSRFDQARAKVNMIGIPSAEKVFSPDMLAALSIVKFKDAALYAKVKDKLKGAGILIRDLERAMKQHAQEAQVAVTDDVLADDPAARDNNIPSISGALDADHMQDKIPDNFKVTPMGVNHIKFTENGPIVTRACGCPVYISARLFNADTETESLKITYLHMGQWRNIVVSRSVAIDSRKVITLADRGLAVSSDGPKYLAKYFDDYLFVNPGIPVQKAVSRFGWRSNEFVFPGLSESVEIDVDDIGSRHAVKGLTPSGELADWINIAQQVRNYSPNARFILAAGFAAPLLKLLSQRNFIIHNHGDSMGGKTATLWLAMSIWGDPNRIIYSFDNTTTSIERRASLFCDLPFGINEREVMSQSKKQQDISPMVYMLAEGKGKGRGGKTGLQELNTWRTIVMTTGEGPLSGASSMDGFMTRTIELEGGPLAGNAELAKNLYSFLPQCHGQAGLEFMRTLLTIDRADLAGFFREAKDWLGKYYPDRLDSHLDALACVMTADYFSGVWIFGTEAITAKSETYEMAAAIADKLILRIDASESERAWLEFKDWVGENSDRLTNSYPTKIGTKDGINIYIIRRVVNEFLSQYSSPQKIIQSWATTEKIRTWKEGEKMRFDYKKSLGGSQVRCIVFAEDSDNLFGNSS